ncbi:phage holin family protein [Streptomyces sp. NPDC057445]|uniref:phage holin family protein n=1 Tax=Streptomyces sp. NPDC057445 TaxID=3346136 RepID=UPI00368AD374
MDTHLSDHVAQVVREALKDELREQTKRQRRTALLYTGSGVVGLYAGGALVACLVLVLSAVMPAWAAPLVVGAALAGVAFALRTAARSEASASPAPLPPEAPPLPSYAPDPGSGIRR